MYSGLWTPPLQGVTAKSTHTSLPFTGLSILFLYTLNILYDKNNTCRIKIKVEIFSVYPDISFDNKNQKKITGISFYNRNNRNNKDNRNNIQKMFKMVSFSAEHNVGLFV